MLLRRLMGLYDRDYVQSDYHGAGHGRPQFRFVWPKPQKAVGYLLIINVVIFVVGALFFDRNRMVAGFPVNALESLFAVFPFSFGAGLQIWRYVSYQFLHADLFHLLFNMLGLYFFGPVLERQWGAKKFLVFYLTCGAAGGLFYSLLVGVNFFGAAPLIGASGSILGIFAACAILFPKMVVFFYIFPLPIRPAALIGAGIYLFYVITQGHNAGGHAAHIAGMGAGALYVWSQNWRTTLRLKLKSGAWEKKVASQRQLQFEVDRILKKVSENGIHSLSMKEKRTLKRATQAEKNRNRAS